MHARTHTQKYGKLIHNYKSSEYNAFVKRLLSLMDGGPSLHHVPFTPHPATAALSDTNAPATEVLTVTFPAAYSAADQSKFEADIKQLVGVIEAHADGYKGSAGGWSIEGVDSAKTSGGDKAKTYVAVIGWQSVEHHLKFRERQEFKDNIHLLRGAKDMLGFDVFHVSFLEVQGPGPLSGEERGAVPTQEAAQDEVLNPQAVGSGAPKAKSDGSTTKNDDVGGAANALHKERQGRNNM